MSLRFLPGSRHLVPRLITTATVRPNPGAFRHLPTYDVVVEYDQAVWSDVFQGVNLIPTTWVATYHSRQEAESAAVQIRAIMRTDD